MPTPASEYFYILQAVDNYYQALVDTGDLWQKFATANPALESAEYANILTTVPDVVPKLNASGNIIGYEYRVPIEVFEDAKGVYTAQTINSNVVTSVATGSGSAAGGTATATAAKTLVKTPINSTTSGGVLTSAKTGLATAGKFVFTEVVPAVMAASCGICLGKIIDSALYNANPDFWDSKGMSALNPETWNDITMGDDSLSARIFNGIFGLNPTTNEGQLYCDEKTLAYMAAFMANKGVFDSGDQHWVLPDDQQSILQYPNNYSNCVYYNLPFSYQNHNASGTTVFQHDITKISGDADVKFLVVQENNAGTYLTPIAISTAPFTIRIVYTNVTTGQIADTYTRQSSSVTREGITYYYVSNMGFSINLANLMTQLEYIRPTDGQAGHMSTWDLAYIYYHGTIEGGGVDGMPDQQGAVIFDPSGLDLTDIDAVLAALKEQYPDLFSGEVEYQYIDENGDQKTTKYVPVGYPNYEPQNPTQPTATTSTQSETAIDPDMDPEILDAIAELINNIIKMQTDPETEETTYTPTADVPTNPNPTDLGSGDTPTVIIPSGSVSALFAVYNPTQAQVNAFGSWLWSSNFVDQLKKIFNDPMESIISLHKVFGTPGRGGSQDIYVGYLDSGVSSQIVSNQYTTVDCGKVTLLEYFGNVFDYTDTDIQLYLPFIGFVPLNVADVMRAQLGVKYHIDVLTGECLADVEVIRDLSGGVIYQYSGNCAVHYPVSSGSYMGIVGSLLGVGAGVAATVASGGVAAPMMLTAGASLLNAHTDVARSGNVTANAGAMGIKKPYLVISRPQTALPTNYAYLDGVGSNQTVALSSCSGFIKVSKIHLQNVSAFDDELTEIESLLSEGVIIQ